MKNISLIAVSFILAFSSCKNDDPGAFAFGNFESEEIIVSAESTGKLLEFSLSEGIDLKKGDRVGVIDTTQLYLKKKQLNSGINSVKAKLNQMDQQLAANAVSTANLTREKNRIEALLGGGAATAKQLDDIKGQIDLMAAQTQVLVSQKRAIRLESETLEIQVMQVNDLISKSIIYSPVNGTVLEKYLFAGELAVTGKPLFKIADLSELILRVFVSGKQLEAIKIGESVKVSIDTENGDLKTYEGKVSWISGKSEFTPKIIQTRDERVNLVYAVKILVSNDGSLKIGMPAEIHLK